MPAARVSPASIERNHHPHSYTQQNRVQEHRYPLTTSRSTTVHPSTRSSCNKVVGKEKVNHRVLVQHPSSKDRKVANGNSFLCDSIRVEQQKENDGKKSWSSFAKRYREWTNRYDNLPRVVDFYGQFEPIQHSPLLLFNSISHNRQVHTSEFTRSSAKQLYNGSQESTESSNLTNSGHNVSIGNEAGSSSSFQIIHSSNCVPSTEPDDHSSNIGISRKEKRRRKNDHQSYDPKKRGGSSYLENGRVTMSPYERIVKCISQNDRWRRELTLGRRIGFYRIRGDVGSGNFSQVKVATHSLTGERVAIKILDKSKLDSKTQVMLNREISSMEKLHHPNLVQLFEVIENFTKIHLVLEYASGGELYQKISNQGKLIEPIAKSLFAQIISAIDHMHRHHIIHRDIKAENVFFSDPETVKVGDFGFSTQVGTMSDLLNTYCGSPPYAAPELFSDECYIGPPVDLWACGVLLYFMVTASMPFKAATVTALKKLILEGDFTIPDYVSFECSWLIRSLLQRDSLNRLGTRDVQKDKWLKGFSFYRSLPKYDCTLISDDDPTYSDEEITSSPSTIVDRGSESKLMYRQKEEDEKVPTEGGIVKKVKKESEVSREVKETMKCLEKLGITSEMLIANQVKGVRSSITGIFRITFHRIISGKYLTMFDSQEQHLEKKNSPPPFLCNDKNGSLKREIDTNQNNDRRPNVPSSSESSSSSPSIGERENDSEKSNSITDKVVKVVGRKGSNNNLMRMPQIFTDSEGYITLPTNDQVKNGGTDINPGYKAKNIYGAKEFDQEPVHHHSKHVSSHLDQVMVYDPMYHGEKKKKKKSWRKRFVSCCVS